MPPAALSEALGERSPACFQMARLAALSLVFSSVRVG